MGQKYDVSANESDTNAEGTTAQHQPHTGLSRSFLARLFRRRTPTPTTSQTPAVEPETIAHTRDLFINLRQMRDKRVDDIAIPRADIIAVPDDIEPQALIEVFRETAMTRLPVYNDTMDNPVGFIHLKDLALRHGFGTESVAFNMRELLRPMLYVPGSMALGPLLQKMQKERRHMALVIDEYGGVDGLVTFEDLVEQIIGEIEDEHDVEDPLPWRVEAPDVYNCRARAELEAFEAETGVDLLPDDLDGDVDSLGGLVFMLTGRVPQRGEIITHPQGHEFEIADADSRSIKRLIVRLRRDPAFDQAAE